MLAETIRTERLDLLPLRVEHAAEMAVALSDPALHTYIGGSPETPEGLLAAWWTARSGGAASSPARATGAVPRARRGRATGRGRAPRPGSPASGTSPVRRAP